MTEDFKQLIKDKMAQEPSDDFRDFLAVLSEQDKAQYDLDSVRLGWEAFKTLHHSSRATDEIDLYKTNANDTAVFHRGRDGERKIVVIGLHPNTTEQEKTDKTLCKIGKAASQNGYDGFVVTHLYAQRSTEPYSLPVAEDTQLMKDNLAAIKELASDGEASFWAAWGKNISLRPYLADALAQIREQIDHAQWLHFGPLTIDGHPRHPSRLRYGWRFSPLDVDEYLVNTLQ